MKITVKKKTLYLLLAIVLLFAFFLGSGFTAFDFGTEKSDTANHPFIKAAYAEAGTKEKFEYLSSQQSSYCGLQSTTVDSYSDEERIQGACCSSMDLHRYQEQVEELKKYKEIEVIPEDPYDMPASLAKQLFDYQKNIKLKNEEQAIYDNAMKIAGEGGPCCCKCWRWYAFEGQAKHLITQYGWEAKEVAELWDVEDGCGGIGHAHDGGH